MHVGFVGLGRMGLPMARNLLRAGFAVSGHDRDPGKRAALEEAGGAWADSPRAAAEGAGVVLTSVFGPQQVEDLARGGDGLLAGLGAGAVWVDLTTNEPALVRLLAEEAAERGAAVLDSPVTGAVDGAIAGRLTLFVGGAAATLESVRSVLEPLARRIIHCGGLGTGNVVKLVTNQLWFIHAAAIGEGLVLGARAGVELTALWQAIRSSVGNSFVAEHDVPSIFAGHYDPSFTLDLCLKDLGLLAREAEAVGTPLPLTELAGERFRLAREAYGGDKGELHVARLLEDAAGVSLRVAGDWTAPWEHEPEG